MSEVKHNQGPISIEVLADNTDREDIYRVNLNVRGWGAFATVVVRQEGFDEDDKQGVANANRLVECWNQHDHLVGELQATRDALKKENDQRKEWSDQIKALDAKLTEQNRNCDILAGACARKDALCSKATKAIEALSQDRAGLYKALNRLVSLHKDHTFVCGDDDQDVVEAVLRQAHVTLGASAP